MDNHFTTQPQWRKLRIEILTRDNYRCRIKGPHCQGVADQVDHIIPVEDGGPIFDPNNLRAACHVCNTWRAQRQKSREGWKRSTARIVLVMGPVGSGKSTYVAEHARPSDFIVDYDAISKAFGPAQPRGAPGGRHSVVDAVRGSVLTRIRRGEVDAETIYIVSANPDAERMFPHHDVVVVDPGRDVVLRRCGQERPAHFVRIVDEWYARRNPVQPSVREW